MKKSTVNNLDNYLSAAEVVRNLSVQFDNDFSFLRHIQNTCKSCFPQIRDLKLLKVILLLWLPKTLVVSRLDWYKSLFRSLCP